MKKGFFRNIQWGLLPTVVALALPTMLEQLMHTAVQYVDTAMVGSIGTTATAAIGVCTSTIWFIMGFMNAPSIGFSVMVARRIGENRPEEAREIIDRLLERGVESYA